ncbi:MAG: hypothetical protein NT135_01390 [Candidatus Berkelbacteria bacterium]|nr:hypothetical protein [Candidatus Berkelbacteria bacterium]
MNKKIIWIAGGVLLLLIICAAAYFFLLRPRIQAGSLPDDSSAALVELTQAYPGNDTGPTFQVFAEKPQAPVGQDSSDLATVTIADSCDANYTEGGASTLVDEKGIEKPNHCIVHLRQKGYKGASYLSAYLILSDGSLIAVNTASSVGNMGADIQVNMYKNETRIVQLYGDAYYRIAKQPKGKVFTIQISDQVFTATGTATFARQIPGYTKTPPDLSSMAGKSMEEMKTAMETMITPEFAVYFGVTEGSGTIGKRGDDDSSDLNMEKGNYYAFSYQHLGKSESQKLGGAKDMFSGTISTKTAGTIFNGFLAKQVAMTKKYALASLTPENGPNLVNIIRTFLKDYGEQTLAEATALEKEKAEAGNYWDDFMNDMAAIDAKRARQKAAEQAKGAPYCKDAGYVLNEDETLCIKTQPDTSYTEDTSGSSSSTGSTSSSCVPPGGASYQLCRMSLPPVGKSTMNGTSCCMNTEINKPTMSGQ